MKKFEIINDKWIKKIDSPEKEVEAMKLKAISKISFKEDEVVGSIVLSGDGVWIMFHYHFKNEFEQFKSDLKFLENLVYNQ